MGKPKTENTKKVAGNAQKASAAAAKAAQADAEREKAAAQDWGKGAKDSSKKAAAEEKAAEAARKKAEKEALLKEEMDSLPSKPTGNKKAAVKKSTPKGPDLSQLDDLNGGGEERKKGALNASGIDNALDALNITSGTADKIDRHPERRFKAAYTQYEERRLEEMKDEKGLRRQQRIDMIRKEFEKSPENPFNQALNGTYDMSKEEMKALREQRREETEARLESN